MLLCMGMLTGCGSQNTAQETSLLTSNRNAIQNETAIHNDEAIPAPSEKKSFAREEIQSSHPQNPARPAAPAVFTPDEEELEIGEQEISYGQITVHFPTEITVETEKAENGGTTVHLMDAREWYEYCSSPLPPRIRFLHYKADYEKEEELKKQQRYNRMRQHCNVRQKKAYESQTRRSCHNRCNWLYFGYYDISSHV